MRYWLIFGVVILVLAACAPSSSSSPATPPYSISEDPPVVAGNNPPVIASDSISEDPPVVAPDNPPSVANTTHTIKSDFDGDGFDDLAIGVPGQTVSSAQEAGAVQVLYGSSQGLTSARNQVWHRGIGGIPKDPTPHEQLGAVVIAGDFNGDGYADLVAASPFAPKENALNVGSVVAIYGSSTGLTAEGSQNLDQPDAISHLFYGASLAVGDFDGNGFDDLAVGVPGWAGNRGTVLILRGSRDGLGQASILGKGQIPHPPGNGATGDFFGGALASGDFNRDGFSDLVIGVPGDAIQRSGKLYMIAGTDNGLDGNASQFFNQDSSLVLDASENGDRFAKTLIAADFDGSKSWDLAIGVPGEEFSSNPGVIDSGAVAVLYGFTGLSTQGNQLWHQDSSGVHGVPESNDRFGSHLTVGDFDGDGFYDVAVSAPFEKFGDHEKAGVVHVLFGSHDGLTSDHEQLWHHEAAQIPQPANESETFGQGLGSGDFNGDGFHDLVVGIPGLVVAGVPDAGGITVLYGTPSGPQVKSSQFWHQGGNGLLGSAESGDKFGNSLTGGETSSLP